MPEFLCYIFEHGALSQKVPRLTPSIDKESKRVFLELSSSEASDSAVYYCALRPTVTGTPTLLCKNLSHGVTGGGESAGNVIASLQSLLIISEGQHIKFSCNYSGSVNNLQWYRQYPNSIPEFLYYIFEHGTLSQKVPRLTPSIDKESKRVFLELSPAEVSDSAVYYCALVPTVTGTPTLLCKNLTHGERGGGGWRYIFYTSPKITQCIYSDH
ncbi:hypothetical protein ACEWY4_007065 [Coilia grayii]|uniref:Ig-like domain-containing protein n=1 Tax=Coilia grayii TaxID=363190 RepID=A0ABD1KFC8_9TELE